MSKGRAVVLEIDKDAAVTALHNIGAQKIFDSTITTEMYECNKRFEVKPSNENSDLYDRLRLLLDGSQQDIRLELRQEADTLQITLDGSVVNKMKEKPTITAQPSERKAISELFVAHGFNRVSFQQQKRIAYMYEPLNVRYNINTWPSIPTYIEISSNDEDAIAAAACLIGYQEDNLESYDDTELFKWYSASPTYMSFADGEVELTHSKLQNIVHVVIKRHGAHLSKNEIKLIADHYIRAEYSGKKTHGLRKLCWDVQYYSDRLGIPKLVKESPALALFDGQYEIGPIAADLGVREVIQRATKNGVAIVGITGAQRFGTLATWTAEIAKAGLIGILTTSTEPFTALPETAKGVIGTNPLSISVPYKSMPIVYDAALSKAPVNMMWLYRLLGLELPGETFIDSTGHYTKDPFTSRYVDVFGGAKGSGLALMLQLLSGPLMGMATHTSFSDPYENAFYFQAIDPTVFQTREQFEKQVEGFIEFARQAPLREGVSDLHLPGETSRRTLEHTQKQQTVRIHAGVAGWIEFLGGN